MARTTIILDRAIDTIYRCEDCPFARTQREGDREDHYCGLTNIHFANYVIGERENVEHRTVDAILPECPIERVVVESPCFGGKVY